MQQTKNFTKDDMAKSLVENGRVGVTKSQALNAIDDIVSSVQCALMRGEVVTLRGFGTLCVVNRKAKAARDIGKGKQITIPAYATVKFTPSKQLKNTLNYGYKK